MKKLKDRFNEDPYFAAFVVATSVVVLSGLIRSSAKMIESSAYAYRASKLI